VQFSQGEGRRSRSKSRVVVDDLVAAFARLSDYVRAVLSLFIPTKSLRDQHWTSGVP
jgi:hypothetical protein